MPLLLCPNDNSSMQTVDRAGVQFDMCPTCRGVWLDRGELEKLMESGAQTVTPPAAQPWTPGSGERGDYGGRGDRGDYGHSYGGHRKKKSSIFDIFD